MNDLHELATNAELDHWPPHLGVTTDAEKIAYLAERLREAGDAEVRADELSDQLVDAQGEIAEREQTIEVLRAENFDLNETIKQLKAKQQQ
jgi:predicted nuclease with TOPRIM domain